MLSLRQLPAPQLTIKTIFTSHNPAPSVAPPYNPAVLPTGEIRALKLNPREKMYIGYKQA